jgi:hypothetical protein
MKSKDNQNQELDKDKDKIEIEDFMPHWADEQKCFTEAGFVMM